MIAPSSVRLWRIHRARSRGPARREYLVEFCLEPLAHLIRGAIGKSDRDDLIYRDVFVAKNVEVSLDQDGCLARARTGGHGDVTVERVSGELLLGFQLARDGQLETDDRRRTTQPSSSVRTLSSFLSWMSCGHSGPRLRLPSPVSRLVIRFPRIRNFS